MSDVKSSYSVSSRSTDVPGRTLNQARTNHWVIDSPSGPNEAVTTGESFLAGISACGVTLIELHARQQGSPFGGLTVDIDAIRTDASMPDFAQLDVRFAFSGVSQEQAAAYVDHWKRH